MFAGPKYTDDMTLISEWMDLCTGGFDVGFSSQLL